MVVTFRHKNKSNKDVYCKVAQILSFSKKGSETIMWQLNRFGSSKLYTSLIPTIRVTNVISLLTIHYYHNSSKVYSLWLPTRVYFAAELSTEFRKLTHPTDYQYPAVFVRPVQICFDQSEARTIPIDQSGVNNLIKPSSLNCTVAAIIICSFYRLLSQEMVQ